MPLSSIRMHPSYKDQDSPRTRYEGYFSRYKVLLPLSVYVIFISGLYLQSLLTRATRFKLPSHFNTCTQPLDPQSISAYRDLRNVSLPPSIASLVDYTRLTNKRNFTTGSRDWVHPFIYEVYADCPTNLKPNAVTAVYLFGQGITLKKQNRVLKVLGCILHGKYIPLAERGENGNVFACALPGWNGEEVDISVVVDHDDKSLKTLLEGEEKFPAKKGESFTNDFETLKDWDIDHKQYNLSESALVVKSSARLHQRKCNVRLDSAEKKEQGMKYEVCLMTQEKLFGKYLKAWVDYHRRIGVDHVYLYDNVIDEGKHIDDMFEGFGDVEVVFWPWQRSQIEAMSHFLLSARSRCKWHLLIDVDEYIMIGRDEMRSLKETLRLRKCEGYNQIVFSEIVMGSSGHERTTKDPLPERYIHKTQNPEKKYLHGKSAAITEEVLIDLNVHSSRLRSGKSYKGNNIEDGYVVHFKTRSWEDNVRKLTGRRGSLVVNEPSYMNDKKKRDELPNNEEMKRRALNLENQERYEEVQSHWRNVIHGKQIRMTSTLLYSSEDTECSVEVDLRTKNIVEREKCYRIGTKKKSVELVEK